MTTTDSRFVIVGAGLAGAKAAETLRDSGFDGRLTLVGDESHRPYERPPLSKGYLRGESDREQVFVHPAGWYAEHDVDLRVDSLVSAVDPGAHEVVLADGERLGYDKLLLSTGSVPRRLTVPGAELEGVLSLRRLEDSERIRAAFAGASRVAVVGAGWIGLETAAAARGAGLDVTLLEHAELPLLRVLGPEVAPVFADLHRRNGVDLSTRVTVVGLLGDGGSVIGVRLDDGTVVDADLVLVGIGIVPDDTLARDAGLAVGNGITVDEHLRTSDPDVHAAGDVADAYHPFLGRHVRVEHWANALHQGPAAARAMLGRDGGGYDRLPYFFSDQYDLGLEYVGHVRPREHDRVVLRGDPAGGEFLAFWLADRRVLAGMAVNRWGTTDSVGELIRSRRPVDPDRLADPGVALDEL